MGLFGKRQAASDTPPSLEARLTLLEGEILKAQSAIRTLETEQLNMHDQVRRWMRRAVAAERAAGSTERPGGEGEPDSAALPRNGGTDPAQQALAGLLSSRTLTPARSRRFQRALRAHQADSGEGD